MCTRKSRSPAEARGVLAGLAVLFLAAVFTITGCSTDSNDDGDKVVPTPPVTVDGTIIYNQDGSTPYAGTGTVQSVTAQLKGFGSGTTPSELGNVGSITADGKLTLNLPATVEDGKLFDAPAAMGFPAGTKVGVVGFTPTLYVCNSDVSKQLDIIYFNKEGTVTMTNPDNPDDSVTLRWAAGWNYFEDELTRVTDISSYKWVYQTGGGGH